MKFDTLPRGRLSLAKICKGKKKKKPTKQHGCRAAHGGEESTRGGEPACTRVYPHPPAGSLRRWDTHGLGQGQELSPVYWGGGEGPCQG